MRHLLIVLLLLYQTAYAQVKTAMWDQEIPADQYYQYTKPQTRQVQSYQYQHIDPDFMELLAETEETILGQTLPNYPIEDRLTVLEQYLHMPISYNVNPKMRLENVLRTAVNISQRARQQAYIPPQQQPMYNLPRPSYDPGRYGDPYGNRNSNNLNTILQVLPTVLDIFRRQRY